MRLLINWCAFPFLGILGLRPDRKDSIELCYEVDAAEFSPLDSLPESFVIYPVDGSDRTRSVSLSGRTIVGSRNTCSKILGTSDPMIVIKTVQDTKSNWLLGELCRDQTILEYLALAGLQTVVPQVYRMQSSALPIYPMVVMENVGEFSLDIFSASDGSILRNHPLLSDIAVRLIELIREIHSHGVFHGDMHACNVMFSNPQDIVGSMRIIDFGSGGFLRSERKPHTRTAIDVFEVFHTMVAISHDGINGGDPSLVDLYHKSRPMTDDDEDLVHRTDYDEWIRLVRTKVSSDTSTEEIGYLFEDGKRVQEVLSSRISPQDHLRRVSQLSAVDFPESEFTLTVDSGIEVTFPANCFESETCMSVSPWKAYGLTRKTWRNYIELEKDEAIDVIFRDWGLPTRSVTVDSHSLKNTIHVYRSTFGPVFTPQTFSQPWRVPRTYASASRFAVSILRFLELIHETGLVTSAIFIEDMLVDPEAEIPVLSSPSRLLQSFAEGEVSSRACTYKRQTNRFRAPGELAGYCPTRFDDLYRLSETLILLLSDKAWVTTGMAPADGLMDAKRSLGDSPGVPKTISDFHAEMMRSQDRDITKPDYAHWISVFSS